MKPLNSAIAAALILVCSPAALAQETPDAPSYVAADARMSEAEVTRDIEVAKSAYSKVHPGYARYATIEEMDAAWQGVIDRAQAQGGMTLSEFYLVSQLVLSKIRCDHTKAELPKSLRDARAGQPLYLPFRWELIEERGVIENVPDGIGLSRGDEIVAIDGRPLAQIVAEVAPYVPVDGYTEWARRGEIAQSSEFMGGAVDHFGALLRKVDPQVQLTIRTAQGDVREVQVDRISFEQWSALATRARNFADAVTFERIGNRAAYLAVDTFVNYRTPVDPQTLYAPIFTALEEEGRDVLILDLRRNGGGSTDASLGLVANLVTTQRPFMREFRAATLDHTPWDGMLGTWDQRALNPDPRGFVANADGTFTLRDGVLEDTGIVQPTDVAFDGQLLILTSTNNSSGSTNILAHLASRPNTVTIGEKTGGSAEGPTAGLIFFLNLPESGITMRVPMFRQWNNTDSFEAGMGITPDISAPMTIAAFRAGSDPALDAAKEIAAQGTDFSDQSPQPVVSISDFVPIVGEDWSGQLEYLNYGSEDRSTIPVRMVARAPGERRMEYGFIYPGEEDKNANDALRVSRDGSRLNGMQVTARYRDATGALVIVTEAQGRDDNRPADIRLTYVIAPNSFVTRKDVRFEDGEYFNRNEYRLTR